MKKLLFIIFVLCGVSSYAQQITLTYSDIGTPIRTYDERVDTAVLSSISPGAAGPSQTWNFSTLHDSLYLSSVNLINTTSAPLSSLFPTATFAARYDSAINYYFFKSVPTALTMVGAVSDYLNTNDSIKLILSVPDTIMRIPANYGDTYTVYSFGDTKSRSHYSYDTLGYAVPIDSVRIKHSQLKTIHFDAWGTVTTPTSTFPALRQKETAISNDSIWGYVNFPLYPPINGWQFLTLRSDTTDTYNWWMKQLGITAVKMTMVKQTPVIQRVDWTYNVFLGIPETQTTTPGLYPNPANEMITISNTSNFSQLVIFDVLGNEISRQNIQNNNQISFSVKPFANGVYFYNLLGKTASNNGKFVVKH
ncbi:MAG: T9SS type A sorting domain-containing protein [Bacteroidota bacterium]